MSKKFDFIVHQRICSHEKNAPLYEAVLLQGEAKNYSIVRVLSDRILSLSSPPYLTHVCTYIRTYQFTSVRNVTQRKVT